MSNTTTLEHLPAGDLEVDYAYQHALDLKRANRYAKNFKEELLGALQISRRKDGRNVIIDGQHRQAATALAMGPDYPLMCVVHVGLNLQEEARLFTELNRERKAPTQYTLHRACSVAGDPFNTTIDECLRQCGLELTGASASANRVSCVASVHRIAKEYGFDYLRQTFEVVIAAWGREPLTYHADLLQSVAGVLWAYDTDLDVARFVRVISKWRPERWRAEVNSSAISQGTVQRSAYGARAMVREYNKKLRNQLPEYDVARATKRRALTRPPRPRKVTA